MNRILKGLHNKKILILGYGREGQSTYEFLRKYYPNSQIGIADQRNLRISADNTKVHVGQTYLDSSSQYDVIFKSPGIPGKLPQIKKSIRDGINITSQTKLFFDLCQGTIIGITGTKGKSTTTTLIYKILKKARFKSVILGNIGKPCLDYLGEDFGKDKYFVFELSSHQLSDLTKSPHIAVLLNIFKEHLDYYRSFEDYIRAKGNITKFQSANDYLVYNSDQKILQKIARNSKARKYGFSVHDKKSTAYVKEGNIYFCGDPIVGIDKVPLFGVHNWLNVMAAVLASKALSIPDKDIRETIKTFKPLEYRLQNIGTYKGIAFIDDSLATIPEATIAAIKAFSGNVGTLILGGSDRGQDFKELAKVILKERVVNLILFPTTGERIWREVRKISTRTNLPKVVFVGNMEDAIGFCFKSTPKRTVCLLSTASPSFTVFRDYEEKSKLFKKYVRRYAKGTKAL